MLTTSQAAALLHVNQSRIRQMIGKGQIKAQKIGRDWMIDEGEIERVSRIKRKAGRPPKSNESYKQFKRQCRKEQNQNERYQRNATTNNQSHV